MRVDLFVCVCQCICVCYFFKYNVYVGTKVWFGNVCICMYSRRCICMRLYLCMHGCMGVCLLVDKQSSMCVVVMRILIDCLHKVTEIWFDN